MVCAQSQDQNLSAVHDVAFSGDGKLVYTCSKDKEVLEWDVASAEVKRKLKGNKAGSTVLAVSAQTQVLAAAGTSVLLVDLASGKRVSKFTEGHASNVSCMAFAPDGSVLATACAAGRFVNLFNCRDLATAGKGGVTRTLTLDTVPMTLALHCDAPTDRHDHR